MSTKIIAFEPAANTYKEILLSSGQEIKISDATTHGYLDEVESKLTDIGIKATNGSHELVAVNAATLSTISINCIGYRKLRIYGDSAENFSFNLAYSSDNAAFAVGDKVQVITYGATFKFSQVVDVPPSYVSVINLTAVNMTNLNLYYHLIN
tara:strand:+ start:554 stop:1009 length:456 start_codon:yes stop_codon:yes gene_type:complete